MRQVVALMVALVVGSTGIVSAQEAGIPVYYNTYIPVLTAGAGINPAVGTYIAPPSYSYTTLAPVGVGHSGGHPGGYTAGYAPPASPAAPAPVGPPTVPAPMVPYPAPVPPITAYVSTMPAVGPYTAYSAFNGVGPAVVPYATYYSGYYAPTLPGPMLTPAGGPAPAEPAIAVQSRVFVPGEPVRNFFRAIAP